MHCFSLFLDSLEVLCLLLGFCINCYLTTVIIGILVGNQQVLGLEQNIRKKMEKEGLMGMAVAGGAILAVGAIVGVGMAIAKAK